MGRAAERQYRLLEELKFSKVTRTGRGSDFAVKGLLASSPRLVEVKTGNAVLSALQRATDPEVVRPNPYVNSALAIGAGAATGAAVTEAVKRLLKEYIRLTCGACGSRTTLDHHFCPLCGKRLSRRIEFWIGVLLMVAGGILALVDLFRLGLNLPVNFLAGALLGAGVDLLLDCLWANFSQPAFDGRIAPG